MMKNTINILLIFAVLTAVSCKDFLETFPPDVVSVNAYYQNEKQATIALNACYDNLSSQLDRLYGLGVDAVGIYCGDLARVGRTSDRWNPYEKNAQDGSEKLVSVIWRECYAGIYRCNLFLEKIDGVEMDAALKTRMIAEAKFLRAFYFFDLTRTFGDVPLVTQTLKADESRVARDPKSVVVSQMIQDFTDAIGGLPLKTGYTSADMGRVTKGAAMAYLTKLYVYEKRWEDAILLGQQVVNSGEYGLFDDYMDNFSVAHENGIESIFEIQCKSGTDSGEGNAHNDLEGFEGTPNPRGYTAPFSAYVNTFGLRSDGSDDPRKAFTTQFSIISPTFYASVKYIEGFSNGKQYDSDLNYKLMRYSDFLLLYAEALNESGQTDEALAMVNTIRQRPSVGMPELTGLSQAEARQAIRDERKWELGLEGHRFFDLVRWGIAGETIRALGRRFDDGVHEVMPLPVSELDLNPALVQNSGY
ncbi:MAG: RagB/SusD family nutrient uptake outer membrane protein [Bacteroidia bacterium]|nr:RagB/SusD family nutrient uptake outer membrane protein [Bacteroidia bacterium]